MPTRHSRRHVQLNLFLPLSPRPHWATLPADVRQKVLPLLTRLIKDQQIPTARSPVQKETGHE